MSNTKKTLLELISERVVIGDGAMGTMIYEQGVFLNRCFDELNLTAGDLIEDIHRRYVEAGADFIETNTFGANELKLSRHGLAERLEEINTSAVEIAKRAAGDKVLVAGSVGPLGAESVTYGVTDSPRVRKAYQRQIKTLVDAGVDFLIFETFSDPNVLRTAVRVAAEITDIPVVAQMSVTGQGETAYGMPLEDALGMIAAEEVVDVVGLNCAVGPSAMLESLERAIRITDKPVSVQPNAGMPRDVDGRMMYMCTPEYMAEYAKRFFEKGASIIGGCCGTGPEHIQEIARAVKSMDRAMRAASSRSSMIVKELSGAKGVDPVPLAQKSRIGRKLSAGEKIFCVELTPPRGTEVDPTIQKARLCAENGIDAINIPDGPRASSRLSPLVTAAKIELCTDIETILHVCCRDRNIIGMQSDMLGAYSMGLRNTLLITGDPPKLGEYPDATAVFDLDSVALTGVMRNLNRALDIAGNELPEPLAMTIGVGANPVAADIEREIERFHQKVSQGAEYAITQPVFDPDMLFKFMDRIADCKIPIVAGIWPFTSYKNAEFMAHEVPGVVVPQELLDRMAKAGSRDEARSLGIEIAREMVEKLWDHVAGFAVSAPFGNVKTALAVLGKEVE